MDNVRWDALKSERLKRTRGASFEEIVESRLIAVKSHHSRMHQEIMLFEHKRYIWVVPFVKKEDEIFLKTLYPSRKYTKLYKEGRAL